MKLKELERQAVQVWSPASQYPVYLATGTSAQQLDASFSTNGTLEIFEVDFRDPSLDLKRKGVLSASSRFHKLIWGSFGSGLLEASGVIAGGGDNGMLTLYNVTHVLSSGKEPVIAQRQKHSGAVRALDFNPFQGNLLASGANDSEIFIWDLNNLSVPMTPGSKSQYREQPLEDIKALSWNRQVQHILSSAHPSGKAVVWDLRKNEPIIKVSDHSNRMHCSGLAWHPDIATQLVLCSEDDRLPVIQLWDLRFASSPLKVLESHSRGILSVSWSQADAELLLSSAKDSQILCWNLGSSEVVYKLPMLSSWCFDVQWCPRDPLVFSAASFDGWINLYSVMGRSWEVQQMRQADKISSSFSKGQPLPPLQVPEQVAQASLIPPLKKPPKWMRRPAGVSFAFGGKLVTFGLPSTPVHQVPQPCLRLVFISQVTTEPELLAQSAELQEALGSGNLLNYCQNKIHQASLQSEKMLWQFLKVTLEKDARMKFLKLLGYSKDELQKKVATWLRSDLRLGEIPQSKGDDLNSNRQQAFSIQDLMEKVMVLNRSLELLRGPDGVSPGPATTYRITQYANLLAAQGSLATAMSYLPSDCAQLPVQQLRDRLFHAQGSGVLGQQSPPFPFPRVVVGATPYSQETSSPRLKFQSSHQVPILPPRPRIFTPQSSLMMPLTPSHPSPYQGSRMQNTSDYRPSGVQEAQPLPLGPGVRPALSQPQLLGGQRAQAPNPVGFPGTWPLLAPPMAPPNIMQPGSVPLPRAPPVHPLFPVRAPGFSPMSSQPPAPPVSFPAAHPPGGPGTPCAGVLPTTGILIPHPGPQDSLKNAPVPKGNLQRKKLPETFMPPAPITAPVMCLTPEPRGVLSSQPAVPSQCQQPLDKINRKELPPEHQSLKISFEALLQRCSLSATDLKTKRKLDEAAQRLECLYDKLCEGTLSPPVLAGLHEIARCVDAGSPEQGLAMHAQVVGCSSFSEVSSFMPVLKSVLTIAHKLRV
ncbi:protein transport protein Sec31B isoform X12 [Bos indicus x Bos taurus]|uniref:protein transport protein Sec31B isoform X12 n=1 Tax=Bos indicus x Bos taurus TaxID=30522 RepID=UPI000F7D58DC|nr:protein transport protein Sec31B isoform X12 [Bos indicus x Bos taurus]